MVTWKIVSKYRGGDALLVSGRRYPLSDEQFKQLHGLVKATDTDRDVLLMYQQVTAPQSQPSFLPPVSPKGMDFEQYLADHPDASFVEAALNSGHVAEAVRAELGQQSEWVQLEWASNWGGGFLCCREVCDPNSGPYSTTDSSKAVIWHEQDELQVLWPDGYTSRHIVHAEELRGTDHDHGKSYDFTYNVPVIFYQVHGVRLSLRLTTPGLKVRRTWVEGRLHA